MKYAIQVNSAYTQSSMPYIAHQFITTAVMQGHEIMRVFFYHDGIYNGYGRSSGQALPMANADAPDWSGLAGLHGVDLVLCIAACERRGLTADDPLLPGFRLGGLGLWMEACLVADRFMVFDG